MANDLLETAYRQAEKAVPSVRAAALLRTARVEAQGDHVRVPPNRSNCGREERAWICPNRALQSVRCRIIRVGQLLGQLMVYSAASGKMELPTGKNHEIKPDFLSSALRQEMGKESSLHVQGAP